MKHLPKHLRPRWRYLAVGLETRPTGEVARRRFDRALHSAARTLLGDAGSAEVDLSLLQFEFADGEGQAVVRTRRAEVDRARAVLACIDEVDGSTLGVHVRGVSGTVRACEERYLRDR